MLQVMSKDFDVATMLLNVVPYFLPRNILVFTESKLSSLALEIVQ
jgi:hypothetical protein